MCFSSCLIQGTRYSFVPKFSGSPKQSHSSPYRRSLGEDGYVAKSLLTET